jgi:hypothetical protein
LFDEDRRGVKVPLEAPVMIPSFPSRGLYPAAAAPPAGALKVVAIASRKYARIKSPVRKQREQGEIKYVKSAYRKWD